MSFTVAAPAKINLHLRVFPAQPNGFHPLRSWFRTIDLADELHAQPADDVMAGDGLELTCSEPSLPTDTTNLVRRAWRAWGTRLPPVRAVLTKRIPTGGGLGGGSSDGAAALALWARLRADSGEPKAGESTLMKAAAALGSDVPFFLHHHLHGTTDATCTGRGEIVEPFTPARRHAVLLMLPRLHVSTPAVYRQFDQMPAPPEDGEPDFATWSRLPALELLPRLRNDLEPPAFALHPELANLRASAEDRLGRPVRMSGSGSSLFTLYDSAEEAEAVRGDVVDRLGLPVILA